MALLATRWRTSTTQTSTGGLRASTSPSPRFCKASSPRFSPPTYGIPRRHHRCLRRHLRARWMESRRRRSRQLTLRPRSRISSRYLPQSLSRRRRPRTRWTRSTPRTVKRSSQYSSRRCRLRHHQRRHHDHHLHHHLVHRHIYHQHRRHIHHLHLHMPWTRTTKYLYQTSRRFSEHCSLG